MNVEQLAQHLRRLWRSAPKGEQNTAVLLFGIMYAHDLTRRTSRVADVVWRSGLPHN